jgi:lactose/L-arabinose transport system ATP-binding protein
MTLADKIVVLRAGRVEQVGAPLDLYRNPDNRFVAGFIGSPAMNFVTAVVKAPGRVLVAGLASDVATAVPLPDAGQQVVIGLRPQTLRLVPGATHKVDVVEALGGVTYVHLSAPSGEKLVVEARGDVLPAIGSTTGLVFEATDALVFAADSEGRRLR